MPFIRITLSGTALSAEQVRHLQDGTTEMMLSIMRKPRGGIAVLVEELGRSAWSIAGAPIGVAAHVEATIGIGTNTAEEKAEFMAAMMELLRAVLGPELREETYIVFHELDTRNYGRGGLTRAERDRRNRAAAG